MRAVRIREIRWSTSSRNGVSGSHHRLSGPRAALFEQARVEQRTGEVRDQFNRRPHVAVGGKCPIDRKTGIVECLLQIR